MVLSLSPTTASFLGTEAGVEPAADGPGSLGAEADISTFAVLEWALDVCPAPSFLGFFRSFPLAKSSTTLKGCQQ